MRKYVFLIPFFLFACKKNDKDIKVSIRQQPTRISVFSVDTGSSLQTLLYEINYFYDDSTKRFDSIIIAGNVYRFDYSRLATENKILLNYINAGSAYSELIIDTVFYSLKTYNERASSAIINSENTLQYDSINRVVNLYYNTLPATDNFSQHYQYKNDSIFLHTVKPAAACETNDTIVNTLVNMSTTLPYLLFANINNTCGVIGLNILKTLPLSNYTNKFPYKIINEITETDYTYTGDSKSRLAEALIITKSKSANLIIQKIKIVIAY